MTAIATGDLGSHPRATVCEMDATAIDAPDGYYDLAVFAVPPPPAATAGRPSIRQGTRVADKLLIIDLPRMPPLLHVVQLMFLLPLAMVFPVMHDGHISALRAYSPSALRTLARYADPAITLELRRTAFNVRGRWQIAVASR